MSIDSYRCTQCSWGASGSGADDRLEQHWRKTHHHIDTIPPAETDWSEGYAVQPLAYRDLQTFDDGDPGVRETARILAGTMLPPADGDCLPDGSICGISNETQGTPLACVSLGTVRTRSTAPATPWSSPPIDTGVRAPGQRARQVAHRGA